MTDQMTALILQGGGALGAYQAGVYEQLAAHNIAPDWIIGTSIGAINGAIIAGNKPEDRVERLNSFWTGMAPLKSPLEGWWPSTWSEWFNPLAPFVAEAAKNAAVVAAMTHGIDGFFVPRFGATLDINAYVNIENAGYYDTSPLRQTLLDHVDFDYLNAEHVRLSVCAVDIASSELMVFDTSTDRLTPEHIMASGALPPAFPPIVIDGRAYWDGGIYSNTPLDVLLAEESDRDALVFMVDLWDPSEPLPTTMAAVMDRQKAIQYAGRTSAQIRIQSYIEALQQAIRTLAEQLPDVAADAELASLIERGRDRTVNVVRLIMKSLPGDDQFKDVDFTSTTIHARWAAGTTDAARALAHKGWLEPAPPHSGLVIHQLDQQEENV